MDTSGGMLPLAAAAAAGPERAGGKGWNLGRLLGFGFPVPAGGVLAAEAYRAFMAAPGLATGQAGLAAVPAAAAGDPAVAAQLQALRAAIRAADLPADAAAGVRGFLARAGLDPVPVAVRSSATAEDSAAASFAGIHASFLNVTGPEAVLEAVKGCYASLWTPQALAYRRRLGLADADVACAVVICAMVQGPGGGPPVAAGVAFSCDPRTGRHDRITISAAPGLGEAVVGGSVNPEEITLGRDVGALAVRERSGHPDPVLTDTQACRLGRLTQRVLWALGDGQDHQDVEWVWDGQQFWLLQARPVTRLPRVTFPAVAHLPVIWSNANLKDAVAGVQSTMGWSMLQPGLRYILYAPIAHVARFPVPTGMEVVRRFSGRAYFDLTTLFWAFYAALGLTPAQVNRTLGGHQPEIPMPPGSPYRGRAGLQRRQRLLGFAFSMWRHGRTYGQHIARTRAAARRFKAVDLRRLTGAELLAHSYRIAAHQAEFGLTFQFGNAAGGAWTAPLETLLERYLPGQGQAVAAALMAGTGQVVSAEHGYRLLDLAAAAAADPAARAYLRAEPPDPHGWEQLPAGSPFRQAFAAFLDEFGHRGVYEVELANPRWNEAPGYLLEQVRLLLAQGPARAPQDAARERRRAAEAAVAKLPLRVRPAVRWLAAQARRAAAQREAGKSAVVALMEPLRLCILECGRRLAAAGRLTAPADVFHLALVDMESYLHAEWDGTGAGALAAHRGAQRAAWAAAAPPDIFILDAQGRPATLAAVAGAAPQAAAPAVRAPGGGALTGVAVAAGRASGPARIIRHPDEGHRLQPGDVLVAPSTDPGWTPLFLRAAAVVMEVGGYLSHGAIVAREYGLPAVVNIPGLLDAVQDGQTLTVDGDTGEVRVGQ